MVVLFDDKVINMFKDIWGIDFDRMIYGHLEEATTYWIRTNNGVRKLPYLTFYHQIRFHETFKNKSVVNVSEGTKETAKEFTYAPVQLEYVVEIVGNSILDQISYIRAFIFKANSSPVIEVVDSDNVTWKFGLYFEEPEDNSDLEAEEESGRVVRTTFTFRAECILLDQAVAEGWISKALANIHLYSGDVDESSEITTIEAE